jgi:hypothetical protein
LFLFQSFKRSDSVSNPRHERQQRRIGYGAFSMFVKDAFDNAPRLLLR